MRRYLNIRLLLPSVRHDTVSVLFSPAAHIQHQMFLPHRLYQLFQVFFQNLPALKHIGCDDHMGCPCPDEFRRVFRRDPAARLQASRICRERKISLSFCGFIKTAVPPVQQNNMAAFQTAFPIQFRIVCGVLIRDKILRRPIPRVL